MNQILKQLSMLAFALVFMAGTAFGQARPSDPDPQQNIAEISQPSSNNEADVDQIAGPQGIGFNEAIINQSGAGSHVAEIKQVYNDKNTRGGTGLREKRLYNITDLVQENLNQQARIHQLAGRGNLVKLTQTGEAGDLGNTATIGQRAGEVVEGYNGQFGSPQGDRALQDGSANDLQIYQSVAPQSMTAIGQNSFSTAGATQIGDNNSIYTANGGGNNFEAQFYQEGTFNDADVVQTGGGQSADVYQKGHRNLADVVQGENFQDAAPNSTVDIFQMGDDHKSFVTQIGGDLNTVDIHQTGTAGFALVSQDGAANTATVNQSGVVIQP
jgi:hypothetical protein